MKPSGAIICNSTNTDLVQLFQANVKAAEEMSDSESILLFTNARNAERLESKLDIGTSSITRSAFFDWRIIADIFLAIAILFRLVISRVRWLHFTTAHVSNLILALPAKLFGIKLVFTIHDLVPHPDRKSKLITLYNDFVIGLLADRVVVFSKTPLSNHKHADKFILLKLAGFEQVIDKPKAGSRTLLFFGRIEHYKGLHNLVDLARRFAEISFDYRIVIAGKGEIEDKEAFDRLENVTLINRYIADDELLDLFEKATFTILPYDSATQSGVVLLSYAYATPVISYDVGALSEYISPQTGYLVEHGDNVSILDLLQDLDTQEIMRLSSFIIDDFKHHYSYEAAIGINIDLYTALNREFT